MKFLRIWLLGLLVGSLAILKASGASPLERKVEEISGGNLTLSTDQNGQKVLKANTEIRRGESLLKLEGSLAISAFDTYPREFHFRDFVGGDSHQANAGRLLVEKYIQKSGPIFEQYFSEEPRLNPKSHYLWSSSSFSVFERFNGNPGGPQVSYGLIEENSKKLISSNVPILNRFKPNFPSEMFTDENYRATMAIQHSNHFPLTKWDYILLKGFSRGSYSVNHSIYPNGKKDTFKKNGPGDAVFPFVDILAKTTPVFFRNAPAELYLNGNLTTEKKKLSELRGYSFKKNERLLIEKTGFDQIKGYKELFYNGYIDSIASSTRIAKKSIDYLASRDYKPGETISFSYGGLSNFETLTRYGFIDQRNPYDALVVDEMIDENEVLPNVKKMAIDFELGEHRRELVLVKNKSPLAKPDERQTIKKVEYLNFTFPPFQISHNYLLYSRGIALSKFSMTPNPSWETIIGLVNGTFNVIVQVEVEAARRYLKAIDTRSKWNSTLKENIQVLQELEKKSEGKEALPVEEELQLDLVEMGLIQKANALRHMTWASRRMLHLTFEDMASFENQVYFEIGTTKNPQGKPKYGEKLVTPQNWETAEEIETNAKPEEPVEEPAEEEKKKKKKPFKKRKNTEVISNLPHPEL